MGVTNKSKEQSRIKELEYSDRYYYNKENDCYIIYIKHLAKNIVISGETHRGMLSAYSGEDQRSVEEICTSFNVPQAIFNEYKSVFGWTRDSMPISAEEIEVNSVEDSVSALLERKKFEIAQKFNKESWTKTQEQANKWREFEAKIYDPFVNYLNKWQPPKYTPYKAAAFRRSNKSLMVCLSDVHYGNYANKKYMFRDKQQGTQYVVDAIDQYANKIIQDVSDQRLNIETLVIASLGDILHSSNPQGMTTKGTQLRFDMLNEEMFDTAFDSLSKFIYKLSQIAPKTKVYATPGNHFGVGDNLLFKALSIYFRQQKNIQFEITYSHALSFRERNMFCIMTHGAHNTIKTKLGAGNKLKMQAQSMIIHSQENMKGIKERIFLTADLHHQKVEEFNDFKYILVPSIVRGDEYSDALGLHSRPCQQTFLIDDNGIKSINNYYFD
jgi:hypothetical protein